jgi:hypothetical protein
LNYGIESWELDALDPSVLVSLTETAILAHLDQPTWDATMQKETEQRQQLERVSAKWGKVVKAIETAAK